MDPMWTNANGHVPRRSGFSVSWNCFYLVMSYKPPITLVITSNTALKPLNIDFVGKIHCSV